MTLHAHNRHRACARMCMRLLRRVKRGGLWLPGSCKCAEFKARFGESAAFRSPVWVLRYWPTAAITESCKRALHTRGYATEPGRCAHEPARFAGTARAIGASVRGPRSVNGYP